MERRELTQEILAAVFFVAGIALIVLFVFTIGKDKGISEPKFQVEVLFRNVAGLSEGAPVRLAGVNVGNVAAIDFLDKEIQDKKVKVTLNIYTKFRKQLKEGTRFTIKTEGVLGEKLLEIYSVGGESPVALDKPVIGEEPVDVSDLAVKFADAAQSFTKTAEELSKVDVVELSEVMSESSRALLVTSQGINDIMKELEEITRKSQRMFDRLEQRIIEGDLFKVF